MGEHVKVECIEHAAHVVQIAPQVVRECRFAPIGKIDGGIGSFRRHTPYRVDRAEAHVEGA